MVAIPFNGPLNSMSSFFFDNSILQTTGSPAVTDRTVYGGIDVVYSAVSPILDIAGIAGEAMFRYLESVLGKVNPLHRLMQKVMDILREFWNRKISPPIRNKEGNGIFIQEKEKQLQPWSSRGRMNGVDFWKHLKG